MIRVDGGKPKTDDPAITERRPPYFLAALFGLIYGLGMCVSWRQLNMGRSVHGSRRYTLVTALALACTLVRTSGTRISFYKSHLLFCKASVGLLDCQVPWNTVLEIVVEFQPDCKVVLDCENTEYQRRPVEIPPSIFPDVRERMGRFTEAAKDTGILLREMWLPLGAFQ